MAAGAGLPSAEASGLWPGPLAPFKSLLLSGSLSPACETGPPLSTSPRCGQEGRRPGQRWRGRHRLRVASCPGPRAPPHLVGARAGGAAVQAAPSRPHPPPRAAPTRPPREAPEAGPPRPPRPPPPEPRPPGLPTGVRLQETARSPLCAPATRRAPDDPADAARPPGGHRRRRGERPPARASDPSPQTGRAAPTGAWEAMGTWAGPAVAGRREPGI